MTLTTITTEDIEAALEEKPLTDMVDSFDKIGSLVVNELVQRLGNPDLAKELPGTLLMKLASDYLKLREKEAANTANQEREPSVLELIDQAGLPLVQKRALLDGEIARLEEQVAELRTIREEL